jgi:putative MATE family efflux protein
VADTAMVGRLGLLELASAGAAGMAYWTISSIFVGASLGVHVLVSRRFGEKKYSEIGQIVVSSTIFIFICGAVFMALIMSFPHLIMQFFSRDETIRRLGQEYLFFRAFGTIPFFLCFNFRGFFDGLGKTYVGMISSITMSISNIFLNYLLIFGKEGFPAMGVKGAAVASSISAFIGLLIYLLMFFLSGAQDILKRKYLKFNREILKSIISLGLWPSLSEGIQNVGFLVFIRIAGFVGPVSLAVSNVLFSILSISFMPGYAFSVAATTLVGQNMGRKKIYLAEAGAIRSSQFSIILMGLMGIAFIVGGENLIALFTQEPEVIRAAHLPLIIVSITQIADASHMVYSGALRGAGLVTWVMSVYAFVTWFLMIPSAYLFALVFEWGTNGLWLSLALWMVSLAIITFVKFNSGSWKKSII